MNELSLIVRAKDLDRKIKTSAQLAQQSLYEMSMGFKEMRDSKLYKELGYQSFEDYCEQETGFKRRHVYNYISIVEELPSDFVQPVAQIGVRKLLLLSKLSDEERTQITENTDLESTTVRELEQEIKQLKIDKDKSEIKLDEVNQENIRISKQKNDLSERIVELECEIKQLESRPVEVAVEDNSNQLQELRDKLEAEKQQALKNANESAEKEISDLKNQLQIANAKMQEQTNSLKVDEDKIKFKDIYAFAIDAIKRLIDFTNNTENNFYKSKVKELANLMIDNIKE